MRKKRMQLAGALVAATALAVVVATSAFGAAAGTPVQKITASVNPSKLPKSDFAPTGLAVTTETFYDNGSGQDDQSKIPPKASRAVVSLPNNLAIDTSVVPQCKSDISTLSTDAAKQACGKSQIGSGHATVALPLGAGGQRVNLDAVVTAFNGPKKGGKPSILLHSYVTSINTTTLLSGVLKPASGKYGYKLDVAIPPLAGGAGAIEEFTVKIKKKDYVQGTCPTNDKTMDFAGTFTTDAGSLKATDKVTCHPSA